ncbi:hypothetical protein M419DRAFT_122713 [Trichoderma reesei RUT C-30]|jgi:hypothetical protein|uniref:Uncharacterized protein n=1 Tax=Hypocrea jecorina (strain ATCC 56765 / BCRC 32924 / NRRL 11460 / Rut C-30) TaxID=1344414 RepID=A0A024SGW2_HYPJR|nr:hypothetical protein M419DRAFT_122713 [Trichoderma reesei RUT C-30]
MTGETKMVGGGGVVVVMVDDDDHDTHDDSDGPDDDGIGELDETPPPWSQARRQQPGSMKANEPKTRRQSRQSRQHEQDKQALTRPRLLFVF